jgi:methyl-accepting chemotaxis protein
MATEDFSGIGDVIRKASEALAETLSAVNKAVKDLAAQAGAGVDREQMVESWLRAARMSKDGMITALEQGFQLWERQVREQVRRTASAAGSEKKSANPMEAWAENWRKATESFSDSGKWTEEARKQAEAVQKTLQDGLRAWQRMWEPEKK